MGKIVLWFVIIVLAVVAVLSLREVEQIAPEPPGLEPIRDAHSVEIRGDRFLVDGRPFFVRGVGYEAGCRPGQFPWERKFEPEALKFDFENIRRAGFNTLRTWAPMTDSELVLAAEHGFWVLQGIWTDWNRYWTDEKYRVEAIENVRAEVARSSRHHNILGYIVMNEPSAGLLVSLGRDAVRKGFEDLRAAARAADSRALVTFSNCPLTDFLDTAPWDFIASNNYPYGPDAISFGTGYRAYTEWIVRRSAPKPYVTTEFGLSVSPEGPGGWGYGGNTLEEQAEGLSTMYREIAASGAAGACPFMWVDGWWKTPNGTPGQENRHDPHAEDWFGFYDVSPQNYLGSPRPVVGALAEVNRLIVLAPSPGSVTGRTIPVRAVCPGGAPTARVGGGAWAEMKAAGHDEWALEIDAPVGTASVEIRGNGVTRLVPVLVAEKASEPGRVVIEGPAGRVREGEDGLFMVTVLDHGGNPAAGREVRIVVHDYAPCLSRKLTLVTDTSGRVVVPVTTLARVGTIGVSASASFDVAGVARRVAEFSFVEIERNPRIESLLAGLAPTPVPAFDFAAEAPARAEFSTVYVGDAELVVGARTGALRLSYKPKTPGGWIYTARSLPRTLDIAACRYLSFRLSSDKAGGLVKVMLVDADGERWFGAAVPAPGSAGTTVVYRLGEELTRDPYDGIKTGNNRYDGDQVAGVAVVVTGGDAIDVRLARMTAWR